MKRKSENLNNNIFLLDSENIKITNVEIGSGSVNYSAEQAENYVKLIEENNQVLGSN